MTGHRRASRLAPLLVLLAVAGSAEAQVPQNPPPIRPLTVGRVLVYPLFALQYGDTDNLFYTETDPVATSVASASAGFLAELPFRDSSGRLGYVAQYRDYDAVDLERPLTHYLDLRGTLGFASGLFLGVDGDLQDGAYDTRLFDPGGEITFRPDPFRNWSFGVEGGHTAANGREIGVRIQRSALTFDRGADDPGTFYDIDTDSVRLRGLHGRRDATAILWTLDWETSDLTRPGDDRTNRGGTASVGLRRSVAEGSLLELLVGWTDRRFERIDRSDTYRGAVGTVTLRRAVPTRVRLQLDLLRTVLPSAFLDADYYVTNQVTLRAETAAKARIVAGGQVSAFRNDYPQTVSSRTDDVLEGKLWIGYRFLSGIAWQVDVSRSRRDSSFDGLGYDELRVGTTLRLGG